MIEADLQLIMRISINNRNKHQIEKGPKISTNNFGSRSNYSIEMAILQKRIIYDNSKLITKPMVYNMTDLEVYYNQKLALIGSIIQESVSIERNTIKLILKIIPNFEHYICTSYSISTKYYRGQKDNLGGSRQGNVFSRAFCRDASYLIMKEAEKRELGFKIERSIIKRK